MAVPVVATFSDPPFEWAEDEFVSPAGYLTRNLVIDKYNLTRDEADLMLKRLVGSSTNNDYLGALNDLIAAYTFPGIDDFTVTIPPISITPDTRPSPDLDNIDENFPTFDSTLGSIPPLPTIDLSALNPADIPEEISAAISWVETSHNNQLFTDLLTRMITDLTAGATGLDATVEAAIFARGISRQAVEEATIQSDAEDYFASTGFEEPTGAYSSKITELANGRATRILDMNQKIIEDQGQLVQKNSQFSITAATTLEGVLRSFTDKTNDRSLDFAKAVAANAIALYAESIKAYLASAEANKMYVEVQVEHLKGVIAYADGVVAVYIAETEAYKANIEALAAKNKAYTDIYGAEIDGYEAETKAITAAQSIVVEEYKLKMQNAEIQLRTTIAEVEAELKGYIAESSLREKIVSEQAGICNQAVASAWSSTNMTASVAHRTGLTQSENFGHTESRQMGYSRGTSKTENVQYTVPEA